MKGIILAGGTGSRLYPLTKVTNKHLLPVYNKPMIYYPLYTLKKAGVTEILIVSGLGHAGNFLELLGSGSQFGLKLTYEVQEKAGGIAQALGLARNFAGEDNVAVLLGDNVIEDDISASINGFTGGACIFVKEVKNPSSYGVIELESNNIKNIIEKPKNPPTNLAVIGCYLYDNKVFEIIENLNPSARNELEITDVNNSYLKNGQLVYKTLDGFWGDCGESYESLLEASYLIKNSKLASFDENLNIV